MAEIKVRTIERREITILNGNLNAEDYEALGRRPHFLLLELYQGGRTPFISKCIMPDVTTPFNNAV